MSRRKPDPVTGELQLTHRERIFINEYIKNGGNGKQAAIAAGYGAARADQSAYQVLHRIQVQQEIQDRISESDVCAKEIIGTLASFMRGNIAQLLDDDGNFDLDLVKQRRLGHLLKTVTRTTREIKTAPGQPPQLVEGYRIQLHSPVQAASILARLMGLNRRTADFEPGDIAAGEPSPVPNDLHNNLNNDLSDDLRAKNNCEPPEPRSRHGIEEILDATLWMESLIRVEMAHQGRSRSEVIKTLIQLRPDAAEFIRPELGPHDDSSTTPLEIPLSTKHAAQALDPVLEDDRCTNAIDNAGTAGADYNPVQHATASGDPATIEERVCAKADRTWLQNTPDGSRGMVKFQPTQPAAHNSTGIPPTGDGGWLSSSLQSQPLTTLLESPRLESNKASHDPEIPNDPNQAALPRGVGMQTPTAEHLKRINNIIDNLKKLNTTQCLEQDSSRRPNTFPEPCTPK